jgi:hypothetical protein
MTTYIEALTPTPDDSRRRYVAWVTAFAKRMLHGEVTELDRERIPAIAADVAKLVRLPPVTVTEAARLLGIKGSTPAAKAQKLRRLERAGVIPPARRSLVSGDRFWWREELAELIATREAA